MDKIIHFHHFVINFAQGEKTSPFFTKVPKVIDSKSTTAIAYIFIGQQYNSFIILQFMSQPILGQDSVLNRC